MGIADQVKEDLVTAMKGGEKDRVGRLRLILSELQKDAKEGAGDEVAVLRRERKRRLDAAKAFYDGDRAELATAEEQEAALIEGYLPAELSDSELDEIVADAVERSGAQSLKDMGRAMGLAIGAVAGRADGARVSAKVKERLGA